jgi:tRNA A-37 threonylcarbamoyl transferase component Bud32
MNTEPIANRCPKCQAPLPANAPRGLCPKCLLAAVSTPTEAGQPADQKPPPPIETVAAAFPQLEIVELVGHGGMGVVYKARQPRLDRLVALKLLPQSLAADAAFAERFNREARVLARLSHPNIVAVHDFGQSGGFFYLLMEFVDGVNLRQAMQAGRFTPQQAMLLVPKICEALQFAHDEGILHRDIKPENILLDTKGRVKIADFGIAKLVGEARENLTLTASGMALGTPHYMAPEQLEHPQDVDQRADIYSLGVVFYEMLTGELPIGRFAPPSQKSNVDARVDEVVFHALEKEREKRFRSAGEVKTSVEAITAHPAAQPAAPTVTAQERRADCYFSTPKRMRNCFPGPQAQIFQCKGDLRLEAADLVFVSPWQTRVVIPWREIRDLSIGQFQMWTTPWVMKYGRINFLAITFGPGDRQRTVHLVPVPPGAASAAQINAQVAEWFEAVRKAVAAITSGSPRVLEPAAVTIRAQRCWNRRAFPFFLAPLAAWLVGILNIRSQDGTSPPAAWAAAFVLTILLCVGLVWFAFGFLKANQALKSGNLDAVTSDEPPDDSASGGGITPAQAGPHSNQPRRPFWWTVSAWVFVAIGLLAVIDTLACLYSRPANPTLYPGLAHLFAGIALLTLSRRWRRVALLALALALVAGAFIGIMMAISPEHGSVKYPALNLSFLATENPRWAATGAVFLALVLIWPCYFLMSVKAKALFGLAKAK